jgi:hypothetical protein
VGKSVRFQGSPAAFQYLPTFCGFDGRHLDLDDESAFSLRAESGKRSRQTTARVETSAAQAEGTSPGAAGTPRDGWLSPVELSAAI